MSEVAAEADQQGVEVQAGVPRRVAAVRDVREAIPHEQRELLIRPEQYAEAGLRDDVEAGGRRGDAPEEAIGPAPSSRYRRARWEPGYSQWRSSADPEMARTVSWSSPRE